MKEIPGYQVDEEAPVSRMASLEVRPIPTAVQESISELYSGSVLTD